MAQSDPVPDDKRCPECGRPLVWYATGAKLNQPADVEADGLYRCRYDHVLMVYSPASRTWSIQEAKG